MARLALSKNNLKRINKYLPIHDHPQAAEYLRGHTRTRLIEVPFFSPCRNTISGKGQWGVF